MSTGGSALHLRGDASRRLAVGRVGQQGADGVRQPHDVVRLERDAGAQLGDATGVVVLVGDERHHDGGHAGRQRPRHRARAAVADQGVGVGEDVGLRDPARDVHVRRHGPQRGRVLVAADGHEQADRQHRQGVDRVAVELRVGADRRHDRAEGEVDQRPVVVAPPVRQRARLVRLGRAEPQDPVDARGLGLLERLRDQAEARRRGEPLELRVGVEADLGADLVERLGERLGEALHVDALRDADADRRKGGRLGREPGGEVGDVVEHHVGLQALDRGDHVRIAGAGVDADEEVGADERVGGVGVLHRLRLREDRIALLRGRIGDLMVVEPGLGDHRRRLGGGGDDDLVVVAEQGVGEGDQGADVAGSGSGADQDAHKGARRPRARDYSRTRAFRREWIATAIATPAASISTSTGVPWRPSTKRLVELVARRVGERDRHRRQRAADLQRPVPEEPQEPVLGHVGGLAQDQVPRPEPGAEVRLGAEEEDHAHQRERRSEPKGEAHRPVMVAG